jgi:monofunctional chorismate mutase|tara:strand:+ start:388 stop:657 length:270 start_codon:yes stop_codon:yes gene_type:complete
MEPEKEINQYRSEIDRIDQEIMRLLCKRFKVVSKIAKTKKNLGIDIEDVAREEDVLANWRKETKNALDDDFLEQFKTLILKQSKKIQRN